MRKLWRSCKQPITHRFTTNVSEHSKSVRSLYGNTVLELIRYPQHKVYSQYEVTIIGISFHKDLLQRQTRVIAVSLRTSWGRISLKQQLLPIQTYDLKHSQKESLFQYYNQRHPNLLFPLKTHPFPHFTQFNLDRRPRQSNPSPAAISRNQRHHPKIKNHPPFHFPSLLFLPLSHPPLFPTYTIASSNTTTRDAATTITMSSNQPIVPLQHQTHPAFRYLPLTLH